MFRLRLTLLTLLLAAAPLADAAAAGVGAVQIDGPRRDKAREEAQDGQRLELRDIVRRVQAGREGRMLGVSPRGDTYVVRWEYPGGRVVDITVDARTGRIIGER